MEVKQFNDKNLSHFSYAVLSDCEKKIILIDPARNPNQYLEYAKEKEAEIVGIIETHPHADFVSSHLEFNKEIGAIIYTSKQSDATYTHQPFDEGESIQLGKIQLKALNTPGHSPDSISVILEHDGRQKAVFTGDTLFIGDCGRPDLPENAGNLQAKRLTLAKQMYSTLRTKFLQFPPDTLVYPTHGAGSLCGKALSDANSSTMENERRSNWSLQEMSEDEFVKVLLEDQPFVPAYFPYNIAINRRGAPNFKESISRVRIGNPIKEKGDLDRLDSSIFIVDARKSDAYREGHLPNSINLMTGLKFETWLGTIIKPGEQFYLGASSKEQLQELIERTAAIGYEGQIMQAFIISYGNVQSKEIDLDNFRNHTGAFTIVDVRNEGERNEQEIFPDSISIPLNDLRERIDEIPTSRPVVVHCAGGYRSAAASSLIQSRLKGEVVVYDLGEAVKSFIK